MLFDNQRVFGQFGDFFVADGEAFTFGFVHVHHLHRFAGFGGVGEHHFNQFGAHGFAQDGGAAGAQGGLVHIEFVGVYRALHHGFAQAVGGGYEHHLVEARFGVHSEHHAGSAAVGAHHALHAGGESHHVVLEAFVHAVGDGAVVIERGKHVVHRFFYVFEALDIQEGFLLSGKGGIGQVFGGGGRTHGHGNLVGARISHQFVPCGFDVGFQLGGEGGVQNPLADLRAHACQLDHIVYIQPGQRGGNALIQAVVRQKCAVGFGRSGKAAGHAHAFFSQLADHFAQGGVFAAHLFYVGHTQIFKPDYILARHDSIPSCG